MNKLLEQRLTRMIRRVIENVENVDDMEVSITKFKKHETDQGRRMSIIKGVVGSYDFTGTWVVKSLNKGKFNNFTLSKNGQPLVVIKNNGNVEFITKDPDRQRVANKLIGKINAAVGDYISQN